MSLSRRSLSILSAIRRARTAPRKLTSTIRAAEPWKYPKSLHQGENETSQNVRGTFAYDDRSGAETFEPFEPGRA